jgi:cytochrome c oxidase subunit 4
MAQSTETIPAEAGTHPADAEAGHHHPTERQYVIVAIVLAAITAVEVALYYVDTGALNVPLLLILALVKFVAVIGYFMHLKFDSRLFRNLFITGLILAIFVYAVFLATLGVLPWDRGENPLEGEEALRSLLR